MAFRCWRTPATRLVLDIRVNPVGNCRRSAISVFSFHPVKIITTGEGGLATTNDPNLAQCMADLRSMALPRMRSVLNGQHQGLELRTAGARLQLSDNPTCKRLSG